MYSDNDIIFFFIKLITIEDEGQPSKQSVSAAVKPRDGGTFLDSEEQEKVNQLLQSYKMLKGMAPKTTSVGVQTGSIQTTKSVVEVGTQNSDAARCDCYGVSERLDRMEKTIEVILSLVQTPRVDSVVEDETEYELPHSFSYESLDFLIVTTVNIDSYNLHTVADVTSGLDEVN